MIHQFKEVVFLAVDVLPHTGGLQSLVELAQTQTRLHITRRATSGRDNALGAFCHQLGIHTRVLTNLSLIRCHRRQVEQVPQTLRIRSQHGLVQVGATTRDVVSTLMRFTPLNALFIKTALRRHICLNADDWLDALGLHLPIERIRAKHIAMVGDTDRRHSLSRNLVGKQINLRHTVEHGVLGVIVEVHEGGVSHESRL